MDSRLLMCPTAQSSTTCSTPTKEPSLQLSGFAAGLASVELAADESVPIGAGGSVGAIGNGFGADQFGPVSFAAFTTDSPGEVNAGQTFTRAVPEPSSLAVLGLVGLVGVARRRRK